MIYKFNNLNFKFQGKDYLASGKATYSIDDFGEEEKEAGFDDVMLDEVLSITGKIPEHSISPFKEAVIVHLNRDESLCRLLAL